MWKKLTLMVALLGLSMLLVLPLTADKPPHNHGGDDGGGGDGLAQTDSTAPQTPYSRRTGGKRRG